MFTVRWELNLDAVCSPTSCYKWLIPSSVLKQRTARTEITCLLPVQVLFNFGVTNSKIDNLGYKRAHCSKLCLSSCVHMTTVMVS